MALKDILEAIIAQSNASLEQQRTVHKREITSLREQAKDKASEAKQVIEANKNQRKNQLKAKATSAAEAYKRNAGLGTKQELLNNLYEQVVEQMAKLPDDKAKEILSACLKRLDISGTIYPAKKHLELIRSLAGGSYEVGEPIETEGGFKFVSKTQEEDFTFRSLVTHYLRPATELSSARTLFTSAA